MKIMRRHSLSTVQRLGSVEPQPLLLACYSSGFLSAETGRVGPPPADIVTQNLHTYTTDTRQNYR